VKTTPAHRIATAICLAVAAVAAPGARAQDADVSAGYCAWVENAAASERAILSSPELFMQVAPDALGSGTRFFGGAAYDLVGSYRSGLVGGRATAECARFRANYAFFMELERGAGETERAALAARVAVLEEALPHARELLARTESAFAGERATVEELQAIRLRADTLAAEHATSSGTLAGLGPRSEPLNARRMAELLGEQVARERDVEAYEAKLRRAEAFRVTVNGGYEQAPSVDRPVPLYGVLEVAYNLGGVRQRRADARALDGRMRWAEAREAGPDSRMRRVLHQLHALLAAEQKRRDEVAALRSAVELRWRSLEGIESERVRRVRDHLWFDWITARAQEAYLGARVRELAVAVEGDAAHQPTPESAPADDAQQLTLAD
jgi:hypothetical protein